MKLFSSLIIIVVAIFISCENAEEYLNAEYDILSEGLTIPENPYDYTPIISEGVMLSIPDFGISIEPDPQRDHQATMGRVLFYDSRLSKNNEVSCASCHDQSRAFSDNLRVSKGIDDLEGHRNALALAVTMGFEISYSGVISSFDEHSGPAFFSWDDSVFSLHEQSRRAITSEVEMGMTMEEVVDKLSSDRVYGILSNNAFGTSAINEHSILEALSVFMNSMSSVNTKFDEGLVSSHGNPQEEFSNFNAAENKGKSIFNRDCSKCHNILHSTSTMSTANNGLEMNYADQGKGARTEQVADMGVFKIPFLRNIALTAPYMHDGRFANLEEVINHYSENIQNHQNLHPVLKDTYGDPKRFNFSSEEKRDLIAYLNTLTDHKIISEDRFSNPFK